MTRALTDHELAAIQQFRIDYSHPARLAHRHCRTWKEVLQLAWYQGWDADRSFLRSIRNDLGPQWLESFEPPPLTAHVFKTPNGYETYFTDGPDLSGVARPHAIHSTKRDAKAHVKSCGATPHNF